MAFDIEGESLDEGDLSLLTVKVSRNMTIEKVKVILDTEGADSEDDAESEHDSGSEHDSESEPDAGSGFGTRM
ncbi:hypothetical protein N7454_000454 [Penicillium verhagenii]|nr:hypothetical protein N7454_000454 [Penicillium verhagenii]